MEPSSGLGTNRMKGPHESRQEVCTGLLFNAILMCKKRRGRLLPVHVAVPTGRPYVTLVSLPVGDARRQF